jgi:hypothetical protein
MTQPGTDPSTWSDLAVSSPLAPSAPIAKAARAFGDDYPALRGQWRVRAAGLLLLVTTLFYVPWMLMSLNDDAWWLAWPFAAANLFSLEHGVLSVFNAWRRQVPGAGRCRQRAGLQRRIQRHQSATRVVRGCQNVRAGLPRAHVRA